MNTKAEACMYAFRVAKFWQHVACVCAAVVMILLFYIAHLHIRMLACGVL